MSDGSGGIPLEDYLSLGNPSGETGPCSWLPYNRISITQRDMCDMLLPLGNVVVDLIDYGYGIPKLLHGCLLASTSSLDNDPTKRIPYRSCKSL